MTVGVLLTCHGTVDRVEDIPAFVANIRRGRPTPPHVLDEVRRRFEHIGGSPLMRISGAQARALEARLGSPVRVAGRLWGPYPVEVLGELEALGVSRVVSLPLAPQSVHIYHAVVEEAVRQLGGLELVRVPPWGLTPALIDAFVETVDEALLRFPAELRSGVGVVLSAHSLPRRVIAAGDPYEVQFREMAGEVGKRFEGRGHVVRVAFQSQGMDGGDWLGPDLKETFERLVREGVKDVVVAPIGFVAEHVETLYDLDVEGPLIAREAGVRSFERAGAVNDRGRFIDALEAVVRGALSSS